ncbi:chemotaxis protein CheW [Salinisphaera sp. Q1T1-3]|uniref:chemotaxis protein CheW n=1 Tax=Salinisphaera sp. Q1T1-3 TaxID=2321229 RepID=UPI000E760E24|nr:chemotaxis protein CheW [Salinisphaera sp. Q1T1-3]RJS95187.1 chemotaxis protein CheA [Salinisphaera sp. Q1T1-3]
MDGSDFYDTFFEEATELLEEMERLLVELDTSAPDLEALNAIFRAAHSIKGGAGTFGFDALQNTTHRMENLLDLARRGEVWLDRSAVDRLLEAGDVLKGQVEAYREGGVPDAEAARRVCDVLERIANDKQGTPADGPSDDVSPDAAAEVRCDDSRRLSITITGIKDGEADLLAEELALFGTVADRRSPRTDALALSLTTTAADDDIIAVLCFIVDADQIVIETAGERPPAPMLRVTVRDVDVATQNSLCAELATLGDVGAPRVDGEAWTVDLTSDLAIADVVAVLGFEADVTRVTVESVAPADSVDRANDKQAGDVATGSSDAASDEASTGTPPATAPPARTSGAKDSGGSDSTSIRVPTDKIDHIINLVGELVITQSMLDRAAGDLERERGEALLAGLSQLAHNARDLQEAVMSMRMVPMDFAFNRFPRLIRDLGAKLGKRVNLQTLGGATELDKGLIERIMDPMTHLVRNSLDHGIEDAATRLAAGKPEAGQLTLSARHEGGNIVIEIADDGAGLSRERILAKARSSGLSIADDMPDSEVWQLIFAPGFSTADAVSDVSGRGVGMDVVKRNITRLGGHVDLRSSPGVGTTVRVILPLTLAIMDGMAVRAGGEVFILPLGAILESMRVAPSDVRTVAADGHVIEVRGEYLRLIELHRVFDIPDAQTELDRGIVVVVTSESRRFALFVDELLGQQQVVVKNLETHFRKVAGVSAATILGDGSVALILDATALARTTAMTRPAPLSPSRATTTHETLESPVHD